MSPLSPPIARKSGEGTSIVQKEDHARFLVMGKAGVNWIKSLPDYARSLNQDPKEELFWKTPFEIYYGRKPNVAGTGNPNMEEWDMHPINIPHDTPPFNRLFKT